MTRSASGTRDIAVNKIEKKNSAIWILYYTVKRKTKRKQINI